MTMLGKGQEKVLSGLQVDTLWPCSWVPSHRVSLAVEGVDLDAPPYCNMASYLE